MLTTQQQDIIKERVKHYVSVAEQKYSRQFQQINVLFSKRGVAAGTARYLGRSVNFNSVIAAENFSAFENTIAHEVAHVISYDLYGKDGWNHGDLWKRTMISLGHNPSRCHSYDTTSVKSERVTYTWNCNCREWHIGGKRHSRLHGNPKAYICPHCHSFLHTFVRKNEPKFDFSTVEKEIKKKDNNQTEETTEDLNNGNKSTVEKESEINDNRISEVRSKSKVEVVRSLVKKWNGSLTTKQMVLMIMNEVGMTEAGARTYLYNARKFFN